MTIEEIRANAPDGATHYDANDDDEPYKLDDDSVYYWRRGFWHFFCYRNRTGDLAMDLKPL